MRKRHNILNINILHTFLTALLMLLGMVCSAQSGNEIENLRKLADQAREYSNGNEPVKLAQTLSKMGLLYTQIKDYDQAIESYKNSASLYLQSRKLNDVRKTYSNIGFIYTDQEDYENALTYMNMALKTARLQNNDTAIAGCITDVAYLLIIEKEYHVAIDKLLDALKLAQDINHHQLVIKCYSMLMECYKALGMDAKFQEYQTKLNNYTNHLKQESQKQQMTDLQVKQQGAEDRLKLEEENQRLLAELGQLRIKEERRKLDSIRSEENERNFRALQQTQEEAYRQAKEDSDKISKANAEKEASRKEFWRWIMAGGLILLLLIMIAILMWRNMRKSRQLNSLLKENNLILEEQSKQIEQWAMELSETNAKISMQKKAISDSIDYARHIQMSMLFNKNLLKKEIPHMAIFFKPRDVVSGDFYWFHRKENRTYIAAIDCTGHGVPGAMLSMIGYNILENIMTNKDIIHPNQIMDNLHMGIRKTLRQDTTENHDGMDMSLCMIDSANGRMEFCGAKNALVIARPGEEAIKIKPNTFGIGGMVEDSEDHSGARHFTNVDIPVYDNATYYIFSDGFSDQFGGSEGKKYMLGRFRKFLSSICEQDMQEQEMLMKMEFKTWKGDNEQTDDVLLIGFRV